MRVHCENDCTVCTHNYHDMACAMGKAKKMYVLQSKKSKKKKIKIILKHSSKGETTTTS